MPEASEATFKLECKLNGHNGLSKEIRTLVVNHLRSQTQDGTLQLKLDGIKIPQSELDVVREKVSTLLAEKGLSGAINTCVFKSGDSGMFRVFAKELAEKDAGDCWANG